MTVVSSGMATATDAYDAVLGLRTSRTFAFTTPFTVNFTYIVNSDGTKTALLSGYQNGSDSAYAYTYDENGNITQIEKGGVSATYVYDKANQLIRENDGFSGKTWTYSYDKFGNMLEKSEYDYTTGDPGTPLDTISYTYSTGEWKDQLVSYDGQAIAYDDMGNPTTYLGETLTWTDGRKLASYGTTSSYVYDKEGMRVQKTVGADVTNFYYNGSLLLGQQTGTAAQYYSYDASGNLLAIYYNGAYYYYLRNGQGDMVGLLDSTGASVVSYTYDAWGKPLTTTGTLATTLGADNPFRYRGYYYDAETGLYYLKSRYYDPDTCRFLNGDVLMSTGQGVNGYNMYGYCNNNCIVLSDTMGSIPSFLRLEDDGGGGSPAPRLTEADYEGYVGGECLSSMSGAAGSWAEQYRAKSRDYEYFAAIYEIDLGDTQYYYLGSTMKGGYGNVIAPFAITSVLGQVSKLGTGRMVGFVHSHPNPPPKTYNDFPSPMDYNLTKLWYIREVYVVPYKYYSATPALIAATNVYSWYYPNHMPSNFANYGF